MNDIANFLGALKAIATSPFSFVGYLALVSAWLFLGWKSQQLRLISERLKDLPERDRLKALQLIDYSPT